MSDEKKPESDGAESETAASGSGASGLGAAESSSDAPTYDASAPPRWAADEPTAMWDDSLLKSEGYNALAADRASNPRRETGPATQKEVRGEDESRVKVSADSTGGHQAVSGPKKTGGVSWVLTIAISLALAVAVFFLVRMLR